MSTFTSRLDAAAGQTTCAVLQVGGQALVGAGAVALLTGNPVPIALGTAALLAANYGCTWDPDQPPAGGGIFSQGQCIRVTGGAGTPEVSYDDGQSWGKLVGFNACGYVYYEEKLVQRTSDTRAIFSQSWETTGGATNYQEVEGPIRLARLFPCPPATCSQTGDEPFPEVPPVTYTDPDTSCEITVTFQGFASLPDESIQPVYKMVPGGTSRASGGIIGGCNFEPVVYMGGPPGQPPIYGPWDPTWPDWDGSGEPPWLDFLKGAIGGAAAAAVNQLLDQLFMTVYPETSKSIYAACQFKEDGTPEEYTINFPAQTYQDRVLDSLTAQVDFAQQFFLWETPICQPCRTPVTGDPVTLNWRSDEPSPISGRRTRKLLTYFDQTGKDLAAHVEHWRNFSFQAGPVVVSPCECELGRPQVWAATEGEGKRVILHAAQIAGVDLSKVEWVVSTPASARLGVGGTMRIHRDRFGTLGVTKRAGSSGFPMGLS